VRPEALPEGPAKWDRAAKGMQRPWLRIDGAYIPLRGRIFLRKKLLRPPRSCPIFPQPIWDKAMRAACFVRLLAKGIDHSLRCLSRIPSRKAVVAPITTYSEVP